MKKIVPFKKDIIFKTNIAEVTSISLEHDLKIEKHLLTGNFIVSGEYKVTDTSIDTEKFNYELPFSIAFDPKYKLENAIIDIEDFYYEIINDSVLSINIESSVDKIEEELIKEEIMEEEINMNYNEFEDKRCIEEEKIELIEPKEIKKDNNVDNYRTYKIYIVRENDSLEQIIEKYNTKREYLEMYNDLSELKVGDKIIIPVMYERN